MLEVEKCYAETRAIWEQYWARYHDFRQLLMEEIERGELTKAEIAKRLKITVPRIYQIVEQHRKYGNTPRKRRGGSGPRKQPTTELQIYRAWRRDGVRSVPKGEKRENA